MCLCMYVYSLKLLHTNVQPYNKPPAHTQKLAQFIAKQMLSLAIAVVLLKSFNCICQISPSLSLHTTTLQHAQKGFLCTYFAKCALLVQYFYTQIALKCIWQRRVLHTPRNECTF